MKILIADDDVLCLSVLKNMLAAKDHELIAVEDGMAAWLAFEQEQPECVITDWEMPKLSGVDLVRKIRTSNCKHYPYILLLTSRSDTADVVNGLSAGADDYLTKPINRPELDARMRPAERIVDLERRLVAQNDELEFRNNELGAANARMRNDLLAAAKIQTSFLPPVEVNISGGCLSSRLIPCDELAGDMLGVSPIDDRHTAFFVLDVMGHGVQSALLAVAVVHTIQAEIKRVSEGIEPLDAIMPGTLLSKLSHQFHSGTAHFLTMVYCVFDSSTREFTYTSAGHMPPMHLHDNRVEPLDMEPAFPIGIAESDYIDQQVILNPGDRILLYSDGLTEASNASDEMLGEDRLMRQLSKSHNMSARKTVDSVQELWQTWIGINKTTDDLSILVFEMSAGVDPQ